MQDCSNSIANAMELLKSCTKPLMWLYGLYTHVLQGYFTATWEKVWFQIASEMILKYAE